MCMYLNPASLPYPQKFLPLRKRQVFFSLASSYRGKPMRKARCEDGSISTGTLGSIVAGRRERWVQRRSGAHCVDSATRNNVSRAPRYDLDLAKDQIF